MPRFTNLTVRVDQQVLLWARMRALFRHQSLNRMVNDFLEELAEIPPDGHPRSARPLLLRADLEQLAAEARDAIQRRAERQAARDAYEAAEAADQATEAAGEPAGEPAEKSSDERRA